MIKLIIYAALLGGFVYAGSTIKLGKRTFFEHVSAIWHTEQVQDLKTGVEDKAKPAVEKLKRGGAAALQAMKGHDAAGSGSDAARDAGSDAEFTTPQTGSGSATRPHRGR